MVDTLTELGNASLPVRRGEQSALYDGVYWDGVGSSYTAWGVGIVPTRIMVAGALRMWLDNLPGIDTLIVQCWSRPVANGVVSFTAPGALAGDIKVFSQRYSPATLLWAPVPAGLYSVELSIAAIGDLSPALIYMFLVTGTLNGAAVSLGCGQAAQNLTLPGYARGYFGYAGGTPQVVSTSGANVAWELQEQIALPDREAGAGARPIPQFRSDSLVTPQFGLTLQLPAVRIDQPYGVLYIPAQSISSPGAASQPQSDLGISLVYNSPSYLTFQFQWGPCTVVNATTLAPLVAGTDYTIDPLRGVITGLKNIATFTVNLAYTGYFQRYDLISANRYTGALTYTQGTSRALDPANWRAATPAGQIPLWLVHRYSDSGADPTIADIVPLWPWRSGVRQGREGDRAIWLANSRRQLQAVIKKLRSGSGIGVAGYGDSRTHMGNFVSGTFVNTNPGGPGRDLISYYIRYPSDTLATIPVFNWSDGAGDVHVEQHPNWQLVNSLNADFAGTPSTYANWGIGGTTSANSTAVNGGITVYNGLYPARLDALLATSPDLIIIDFGMNELGATTTYANIFSMVTQVKTAGPAAILMTPSREQPAWGHLDQTYWRFTCDEIQKAADDCDVTCVNSWELLADQNLGASLIAPRSLADATMQNHDGLVEQNARAALLGSIFQGI